MRLAHRLPRWALLAGIFAGLLACEVPAEPAQLGTVRLPLVPALLGADTLMITILDGERAVSTTPLTLPWPDEVTLPVEAGVERRLTLSAGVGLLPLAEGESDVFTAPAEGTIDVTIVVDMVGVLEVQPLQIPLGGVLSVRARPVDPYPGQPAEYALLDQGARFEQTLPVGRYTLAFELDVEFLGWQPAADVEVTVVAGSRQRWAEPIVDPVLPLPEPAIAEVLEVLVDGGALLGGLTPEAGDIRVRALDAEGRVASSYRGEVRFDALDGVDLLQPARLPMPYRFTEADAGVHTFADGLLAPAALITGTVGLLVSDDTGLMTPLMVPVRLL